MKRSSGKKSYQTKAATIGCFGPITAAIITVLGTILVAYFFTMNNTVQKNNSTEPTPPVGNFNAVENINNNRIRNTNNSQNTPEPTTPTPPPAEPFTVFQNGVTYKLVDAHFEGSDLYFWFLATNEDADKDICLRFSSFLTDENGDPHLSRYRLAGEAKGFLDCFDVGLKNGIKTRFGLMFESIPPKTKRIQLLQVDIQDESDLQMKNIPIPYKRKK